MNPGKKKHSLQTSAPEKSAASDGALPCLMVIDDDGTIRQTLHAALGQGYEVIGLPSGEDALQMIESYKPKLLILDINMPGSDGFEVCQKIRACAATRRLPILFMTARKDDASFLNSLQAGGDSYITKPFEIAELESRIEYLINSRRSS